MSAFDDKDIVEQEVIHHKEELPFETLVSLLEYHPFEHDIIELDDTRLIFASYENEIRQGIKDNRRIGLIKQLNELSNIHAKWVKRDLGRLGVGSELEEHEADYNQVTHFKAHTIDVDIDELRHAIIRSKDDLIHDERYSQLINQATEGKNSFIADCSSREEAIALRLLEYGYNGKLTKQISNLKETQTCFNNLEGRSLPETKDHSEAAALMMGMIGMSPIVAAGTMASVLGPVALVVIPATLIVAAGLCYGGYKVGQYFDEKEQVELLTNISKFKLTPEIVAAIDKEKGLGDDITRAVEKAKTIVTEIIDEFQNSETKPLDIMSDIEVQDKKSAQSTSWTKRVMDSDNNSKGNGPAPAA
jgi:hypothetical protein